MSLQCGAQKTQNPPHEVLENGTTPPARTTHELVKAASKRTRRARNAPRQRHLALSVQGLAAFPTLPSRTTLRRWILLALERDAAIVLRSLILRFVATPEGRRLNREFRGRDYATNVLTFIYMEEPVRADIVICEPVVRAEARAQNKEFRDHLAYLVIHGALHAQGHDHVSPAQARRMERRELELLSRLGVADPYA